MHSYFWLSLLYSRFLSPLSLPYHFPVGLTSLCIVHLLLLPGHASANFLITLNSANFIFFLFLAVSASCPMLSSTVETLWFTLLTFSYLVLFSPSTAPLPVLAVLCCARVQQTFSTEEGSWWIWVHFDVLLTRYTNIVRNLTLGKSYQERSGVLIFRFYPKRLLHLSHVIFISYTCL